MAIYDEELVIVAEAKHGTIASPNDLPSKSILAFHPGCPHRKRLEDWFARGHVIPERIVEVGSYHLILGCVAVGMGVVVPHSVLETYTDRDRLSVHKLCEIRAGEDPVGLAQGSTMRPRIVALSVAAGGAIRSTWKAPRERSQRLALTHYSPPAAVRRGPRLQR